MATPSPYKHITLVVPVALNTDWYTTVAPEEAGEALTLGATLHTTVKNIKAGEAVAELEARQATELATLKATKEEQLATLQTELDATIAERTAATARAQTLLETQRAEATATATADKERLKSAHATQMAEAQSELTALKERCAALEARRKTVEEGREADIRVAEERTRVLLQQALDEKEKAKCAAESLLASLQTSYSALTIQVSALNDLIRCKQQNVRAKGTAYENEFRAKLTVAFGLVHGFKIIDSARSSAGHAADYITHLEDHKVMWETKDYDKPVPTAEVDKFRRDMKENHDVRIGVMISRATPITGMCDTGDRTVEFRDGKLLIYLSNFEAMSDDMLPSLLLLFRLYWANDKGEEEEVEEATQVAIRQVERDLADAQKARGEWKRYKTQMTDVLRWMEEQVEARESRLRATLNVLQGSVESVTVPPGLFSDPAGDKVMVEDIQTILRHATPDPTSTIPLNDLAKAFAEERKISADAAKTHLRAVLLNSVMEVRAGKATLVRGLRAKTP